MGSKKDNGGRKKEERRVEKTVTMEVVERGRVKRMEFASEEDRLGWEKAYRKSKWYTPYFLLGVGINFLLYKAGLDLSRNMLVGFIIGVGIPLLSMFVLAELHYQISAGKKTKK